MLYLNILLKDSRLSVKLNLTLTSVVFESPRNQQNYGCNDNLTLTSVVFEFDEYIAKNYIIYI